jgi:hypothetical protein
MYYGYQYAYWILKRIPELKFPYGITEPYNVAMHLTKKGDIVSRVDFSHNQIVV